MRPLHVPLHQSAERCTATCQRADGVHEHMASLSVSSMRTTQFLCMKVLDGGMLTAGWGGHL